VAKALERHRVAECEHRVGDESRQARERSPQWRLFDRQVTPRSGRHDRDLDSGDARGSESHLEHDAARTLPVDDLRRVVELGDCRPERVVELGPDLGPGIVHPPDAPSTQHPTRIGVGVVENIEDDLGLGRDGDAIARHPRAVPSGRVLQTNVKGPGREAGSRTRFDLDRFSRSVSSALVTALFGFACFGRGPSLLGFGLLDRDVALRVGLLLLRFTFALHLVVAGHSSDGLLGLALDALHDPLDPCFGSTLVVSHAVPLLPNTSEEAIPRTWNVEPSGSASVCGPSK